MHNDASSITRKILVLTKFSESSSKHSHSHSLPSKNPHANLTPAERLERLFMFLEAQFGAENVTPIAVPKLPAKKESVNPNLAPKDEAADDSAAEMSEDDEKEVELMQQKEIERLHKIGIPVPGVEIKVDKHVAKVWLEDLEIECPSKIFAERVRAVVESAVEVTAPLWA